MSGIESSGLSRATVQAMIDAGGGGVALAPGVVPDLLTVGHPLVGSWWVNTPMVGSSYMIQPTGNGYAFSAFGGGTGGALPDPIGLVFTTPAAVNNGSGWYNLGSEVTLSRRPWMRGRVKVSGTATDQAVFVGWSRYPSGSPFGAGGAISNDTLVMMVDGTTHGGSYADTTWKIRSKAAGAVTTVDTLVPYTAGHDYDLYFYTDGVTVTWAIYDRTTATAYGAANVALANAPATATLLGCVYYGMSGAAGAALTLTWGPCTRGNFGPA